MQKSLAKMNIATKAPIKQAKFIQSEIFINSSYTTELLKTFIA